MARDKGVLPSFSLCTAVAVLVSNERKISGNKTRRIQKGIQPASDRHQVRISAGICTII